MKCTHCGRRIAKPAGETERGPVGPVCAEKLGLPRPIKRLRKDGKPRAKPVRLFARIRAAAVDPAQVDWVQEMAA